MRLDRTKLAVLCLTAAGTVWSQQPAAPEIAGQDVFDCIDANPERTDWHLASNSFLMIRTGAGLDADYFVSELPQRCELQPRIDERDREPVVRAGFVDSNGGPIGDGLLCRGDLLYTPDPIQQLYATDEPPPLNRATHCALGPFWSMSRDEGIATWRDFIDTGTPFDFVLTDEVETDAMAGDEAHWERIDLPAERAFSGAGQPDVSGNGRYLVFVGRTSTTDDRPTTYLYDRRTNALTAPLVGSLEEATEPSISADGRFIAFTTIGPGRSVDIFRYEIATGTLDTLRRLNSSAQDFEPRISGDGRLILHSRWTYRSARRRSRADRSSRGVEIFLFDSDENDYIKHKFPLEVDAESSPVISDDGRHIAATTCRSRSRQRFCAVWPEGPHAVYDRLLEVTFWHDRPTVDLNLDASSVLYVGGPDHSPTLLYADLDRGITIPLPRDAPPPIVSTGRISADGRFLIYETDALRCFEESAARFEAEPEPAECYSGLAMYRLVN